MVVATICQELMQRSNYSQFHDFSQYRKITECNVKQNVCQQIQIIVTSELLLIASLFRIKILSLISITYRHYPHNSNYKHFILNILFSGRGATFICHFFCVFALDKIQFMKWLLRNGGATYLRNLTDTVETVQYSDSQCTQQQY